MFSGFENRAREGKEAEEDVEEKVDPLREELEAIDLGAGTATLDALYALLENEREDEDAVKVKEATFDKIVRVYCRESMYEEVLGMIERNASFFSKLTKAKTAKIIRSMLQVVSEEGASLSLQADLCHRIIDWCETERRTFLKQRVQSKLSSVLFEEGKFQESATLLTQLLRELKKLDDKQLLLETHLIESKVYHAIHNLPKSKASLTAARNIGTSIYITPALQAEMDSLSGILYCEEKDHRTSYSYFLEAFEAYNTLFKQYGRQEDWDHAAHALRSMILSKILNDQAHDITGLLTAKNTVRYVDDVGVQDMRRVGLAAEHRSLEEFKDALENASDLIKEDSLVQNHTTVLYDTMLETNLLKIISPYSRIELEEVARKMNLSEQVVVKKCSQLILDGKLHGILDQGQGLLIVYDEEASHSTSIDVSSSSLRVLKNLDNVLDALFHKAGAISAQQEEEST